jgi:hypothetical protein
VRLGIVLFCLIPILLLPLVDAMQSITISDNTGESIDGHTVVANLDSSWVTSWANKLYSGGSIPWNKFSVQWSGIIEYRAFLRTDNYSQVDILIIRPDMLTPGKAYTLEDELKFATSLYLSSGLGLGIDDPLGIFFNPYSKETTEDSESGFVIPLGKMIAYNGSKAYLIEQNGHFVSMNTGKEVGALREAIAFNQGNDIVVIGAITKQDNDIGPIDVINSITVS